MREWSQNTDDATPGHRGDLNVSGWSRFECQFEQRRFERSSAEPNGKTFAGVDRVSTSSSDHLTGNNGDRSAGIDQR